MKKFLSSTMTWGSYFRFGGVMSLIGVSMVWLYWDEATAWLGEKIYKILPKKEE